MGATWGGMGGAWTRTVAAMPTHLRRRILPVDQLNTEWQTLGRSKRSVQALQQLAQHDAALARLVFGADPPAPCPTPFDLIEHMRRARGRRNREEAADLVRIMLRQAGLNPLIPRFLLQAMIPGMVVVATRLQWGEGGDWEDGNEFFSELLSTAWVVVRDWSGQDRPYAVLDLLSAIRCRMRRQLLRAKDRRQLHTPLGPAVTDGLEARHETDLEVLARLLIELRRSGMRSEEVEVLYAQHVLGFSIAELALLTGRDRRALYSRRDRGRQRICA
jgi:hypothetical protein